MTQIMCSHRLCRGKMEDVMAENLKRRLPFDSPPTPEKKKTGAGELQGATRDLFPAS